MQMLASSYSQVYFRQLFPEPRVLVTFIHLPRIISVTGVQMQRDALCEIRRSDENRNISIHFGTSRLLLIIPYGVLMA